MNFHQNINELSIESLYGPIEDPWVVFPFAAPPLRAILFTVNKSPNQQAIEKQMMSMQREEKPFRITIRPCTLPAMRQNSYGIAKPIILIDSQNIDGTLNVIGELSARACRARIHQATAQVSTDCIDGS